MSHREMTALEFLNRITEVKQNCWTKAQVSEVMLNGTDIAKEQMWKEIEAAGGYEALDDGILKKEAKENKEEFDNDIKF